MNETAKNYDARVRNGDFLRYLHGHGIDIGGGDDCLRLPADIDGDVRLWDLGDGNAQYLFSIPDESFDFVYSSHCLEHMIDVDKAFMNWLRICKVGGYLYICVPHEHYYEKDRWPSENNADHKWSFTADVKTSLPKNIAIRGFLDKYSRYIDVLEIRENLMNYDFSCDPLIDQTADQGRNVCAQIDFVVKKKERVDLSIMHSIKNSINCAFDHMRIITIPAVERRIHYLIPRFIRGALRDGYYRLIGREK